MTRRLAAAVREVGHWLDETYALDLDLDPEQFLVSLSPDEASEWLPPGSRSGLVVMEAEDEIHVGVHLDPDDQDDVATVVEETSHLVCLAWHASRDLPVSLLVLEMQAEIDRFAVSRLGRGTGPLRHFSEYRWAEGLTESARARYEVAHHRAHRYCRELTRRFPRRADTPAMLSELRRFYRASPDAKLSAAA